MTGRIWGQAPHWNPIVSPVYIGLYRRATLSRHTGEPIIQEYNYVGGYWATERDMKLAEVRQYFGVGCYEKNMQ